MWILESDGHAFEGKRLWLRPGKRHLFGRTAADANCHIIQDKTISRKHLRIDITEVKEGDSSNLQLRSTVTIEDLNTKLGTLVNGKQIKGERLDLIEDTNEIKLGHFPDTFRITWQPVVLSFSFSKKELQTDPWAAVRKRVELMDVKCTAGYDYTHTTHVVSKKRNTAKGLQALINGKYVVDGAFMEAILEAAAPQAAGGVEASALEMDFDGNWPDAMKYLPPRGDAAGADRSDHIFAPDPRRRKVFEGYTFIFYERRRFEDLQPAITNGKGKALLIEVVPGETEIHNFILDVKAIAGEKGLGLFEDGSEGKGVVVVRYVPPHGDEKEEWFLNFYNQVALRLDHRLIELRDFLPAILDVDAGQLKRCLEFDVTQPDPVESVPDQRTTDTKNDLMRDAHGLPEQEARGQSSPPRTRIRGRRAPVSRFKGFDIGIDEEDEQINHASLPCAAPDNTVEKVAIMTRTEGGSAAANHSPRKRYLPESDHDIMEDVAPTAAAIKRRRIESGEAPAPPRQPSRSPVGDDTPASPPTQRKGRGKKTLKVTVMRGNKDLQDDDILDLAIQHREEEEAAAQAARDRLTRELVDGDIDFEAIRRLTIVEPMEARQRPKQRTREQDIEEGSWDPRWNGRKNFKKFRKQGEPASRPQQRIIMSLEPVRMKEYGIGDEYWLEDGCGMKGNDKHDGAKKADSPSQAAEPTQTLGRSQQPTTKANERARYVIGSDDSAAEAEYSDKDNQTIDTRGTEPAVEPSGRRKDIAVESLAAAAARNSQARRQTLSGPRSRKRKATEPLAREKTTTTKRATRSTKQPRLGADNEDEEESDDGLSFRFGKRQ